MKPLLFCMTLLVTSVSFADPSGKRWPLPPCGAGCRTGTVCVSNTCAVQYRQATSVGNTGAMSINGGIPFSAVVARTPAVFAAWTTGRVSCNTSWVSAQGAPFSTPAPAAINATDNSNNIIWLSGSEWPHLPNELAVTSVSAFNANNEIFDADMELNNNITWSDTLAAGTYDPESVVLHEAGHFLGLSHTASTNAVMYAIVYPSQAKRVLTALDQADVCTVYPGASGVQGTSCSDDTSCVSPLICRARAGSTSGICTQTCTSSTVCPIGTTCQAANTGMACLPRVGVPDQCHSCQSGSDCSSGLCLRFEETGITFCSLSCTESAQCGPNYDCQLPEGYCVPSAMTCTNQCTSTAQCAAGSVCTGGTCTPRGEPGDVCTVSLFCKGCGVCTRETADSPLSFCRTCCAGMGLGGTCSACPDTSCPSNGTCAPLAVGNSSVCVPGASAPSSCQSCMNGECADGLTCVGGRCRVSCNPENPGSCSACFALTSGGGACACTDEIAEEGQPCGLGGTIATCRTGLSCVGAPSAVCRAQCDLSDLNSCQQGQTCQLSSNGKPVCMPTSSGTACASCTSTGGCAAGLSCFQGRCYLPCNTNQPTACAGCVPTTATGDGICGCQDEVSPQDGPCGTEPTVHICQLGTRCLNGACRARCEPAQAATCPQGTTCISVSGEYYCTEPNSGGGFGGGGRSGGAGGGTGGGSGDQGCGCGASGPEGLLAVLVLTLLRRACQR